MPIYGLKFLRGSQERDVLSGQARRKSRRGGKLTKPGGAVIDIGKYREGAKNLKANQEKKRREHAPREEYAVLTGRKGIKSGEQLKYELKTKDY